METVPSERSRPLIALRQALRAADSCGLLLALLVGSYIAFSVSADAETA